MKPSHNSLPFLLLGIFFPVLGILTSGCQTTIPAQGFKRPLVSSQVSHYGGSPLSGEIALPPPPRESFIPVSVTFVALEDFPVDSLSPLSENASLILNAGSTNPFLSTGRLTRAIRMTRSDQEIKDIKADLEQGRFGSHAALSTLVGSVAPGITSRFTLKSVVSRRIPNWYERIRESMELELHLKEAKKGAIVAISVHGVAPAEASKNDDDPDATPTFLDQEGQRQTLVEETTLIETQADSGATQALLVIPSPFASPSCRFIATFVSWKPTPPEPGSAGFSAHEAHVSRALHDLSRRKSEDDNEEPDTSGLPAQLALRQGLQGLENPDTRRNSFAFLSRSTKASLAENLSLSASDPFLKELSRRLLGPLAASRHALTEDKLGWIIEKAAYKLLADLQKEDSITPSLEALLVAHAGEAGRSGELIGDVLQQVNGIEELHREWIQENLIFLEDRSPSARLRAFDWLTGQGKVLEGYDPLGPREERRESLRNLVQVSGVQP